EVVPFELVLVREAPLADGPEARVEADAAAGRLVAVESAVLDAVLEEERVVAVGERARAALVPEDRDPAVGAEDAAQLGDGRCDVEPVEGLRGDREIDAGVGQAGRGGLALPGAAAAGGARVGQHLLVRGDAADAAAAAGG